MAGETYHTYIPNPLPPEPSLQIDKIYQLLDQANIAIGRLDGIGNILPEQDLFLYMYIRKEAVMSSQIEGTQSSLSDLLMYENEEAPGVPEYDVIEVSNYVAAMEHGLKRLLEGFPLSLRLIREIHEILLSRGRGSNKQAGNFVVRKIGLVAHVPATQNLFHRRLKEQWSCSGNLKNFYIMINIICRL